MRSFKNLMGGVGSDLLTLPEVELRRQQGLWFTPAEWQALVSRHFSVWASESHFRYWQPGDTIANEGTRILIGAVTWSVYDVDLLDTVNLFLDEHELNGYSFDIFNLDDCLTVEDLEAYVPDHGQTFIYPPFVGVWENGVLKDKDWSYAARELLDRHLNLDLNHQYK